MNVLSIRVLVMRGQGLLLIETRGVVVFPVIRVRPCSVLCFRLIGLTVIRTRFGSVLLFGIGGRCSRGSGFRSGRGRVGIVMGAFRAFASRRLGR